MKVKRSLLGTILVVCVALCTSYARGDEVDDMTEEALVRSGLVKQLDMLPATFVSVLPDDVFADRSMRREFSKFVLQALGKEKLVTTLKSAIKLDLNRDALEEVVAFYRSGVGRKVGRLQGRALAVSSIQHVREGRKAAASMDESRASILKRIIDAERISEANFQLLDHVVNGLADGILTNGDANAEKIREQLRTIIERNRSVDDRTEAIALVAYSQTFRSLSDKELEKLAEHNESEPAEWFRTTVQRGLEDAVYLTAKALGEAISGTSTFPADKGSDNR